KPHRSWEGPQRKCQGFKPDRGNPAVRDYRGASGNVAMVEMRSHLATERAGVVTLHLKAGAPEFYPNRARDARLKRDVALKVLPHAFATAPERMARFELDAKVFASLNHPNIAAIWGVEDRAIVREWVEGEPPAGPLPVQTALDYARQIAVALEAAHEKGIIHR